MKRAQLIVAGLAVMAGIGAFMLSGGKPKTVIVKEQVAAQPAGPPLDQILVVTKDVSLGETLTDRVLAWKAWPKDSISKFHVNKKDNPKALEEYKGALAISPLLKGDPVNSARVAKTDGRGVMAALLPKGMRAVAISISPETGAGGFILPNNRVDVLLTRRERAGSANARDNILTETILPNVRVLAIDQTIQEKDGEKVVVGRTATLELTQRQVESLSMAKQLAAGGGELSLALRSLADVSKNETNDEMQPRKDESGGSMTVVRFGVQTQVPVNR